MNEIRLNAMYRTTPMNSRMKIPHEEQVAIIKQRLAHQVADLIMRRAAYFTETTFSDGSVEWRAECYVLTAQDLREFVDQIRKDTLQGMPTLFGGAR